MKTAQKRHLVATTLALLPKPVTQSFSSCRTMSSDNKVLELSISDFFSKAVASGTRRHCDAFANKAFGGWIKRLPLQGAFNSTVAAANGSHPLGRKGGVSARRRRLDGSPRNPSRLHRWLYFPWHDLRIVVIITGLTNVHGGQALRR